GKAQEHDVAALAEGGRRARSLRALRHQRVDRGRGEVVDHQRVDMVHEVCRHRRAHAPETEESDRRHKACAIGTRGARSTRAMSFSDGKHVSTRGSWPGITWSSEPPASVITRSWARE